MKLRPPAQIKLLVSEGYNIRAAHIAFWGRDLSLMEWLVFNYKLARDDVKNSKSRLSDRDKERHLKNEQWTLCSTILRAIDENNFDRLSELAKAVEFLKLSNSGEDKLRLDLLQLKYFCEQSGLKYTIPEIAEWLRRRGIKGISESDEGFSQLRRLCKDLQIPYRRIRKK